MKNGNRLIDLTGKRFGHLTVIKRASNTNCNGHITTRWVCRCDCGTEKVISGKHLKSGAVISCGCIGQEHSRAAKITHGKAHSRLYGVWCNMKNRCYNPNVSCYKRYGGRGIGVCDEWKNSFQAFYEWAKKRDMTKRPNMGNAPLTALTTMVTIRQRIAGGSILRRKLKTAGRAIVIIGPIARWGRVECTK